MDLSLPKKSDESDSEWEDIDDDDDDDDLENNSGRNYPLKVKHVCESCESVLNDMLDQGELVSLSHAKVCPSCNHKSMHQPYYNICSICVRLLRKCALCCGDYNEDHIDPRDVLLTPCLKNVLDVFPDPYQRKLIRFIYKKWESFLEKDDVQIDVFRKEYMTMAFGFVNEIETLKTKRDENKVKLGFELTENVNEEMKRIKNELNAMTEEEVAELRNIELQVNSDIIDSGDMLKCMEVMPPNYLDDTELGESSKMPYTTYFEEEEEPHPPEPFQVSLSDEEVIGDWNDSKTGGAENLTIDKKCVAFNLDKKVGDNNTSVEKVTEHNKREHLEAGDDVNIKKKKNEVKKVNPIEPRRGQKIKNNAESVDESLRKKMKSQKSQKAEPDFPVPGCSGIGDTKKWKGRSKGPKGKKH